MMPSPRGLFVTGTDTGIGKTEVGCAVARIWRARGLTVGVCKPAETGVGEKGPEDAQRLAAAAEDTRPLDEICPVQLPEPLAPSVAAERARAPIDPDRLTAAILAAGRGRDRVLAESAGGLLVPYAAGVDGVDLIVRSGLPALLVARLGLGTINHTRLSVECLRARKVKIAGVVISVGAADVAPPVGDVAAETNPAVLASLLDGIPVIVFPHVDRDAPPRVPALEALVV